MRQPEPSNRENRDPQRPNEEQRGRGELEELRRSGEAFLAAGDAAIRRALSGDSEAFLRANRQQGGE